MSNASADEHDSLNLAGMAGLYALDALEGEELLKFEALLATNAELRDEVAGFRATAGRLSEVSAAMPPAALRTNVLAQVAMTRQDPPVIRLDERRRASAGRRALLGAVAAGLIVLAGFGGYAIADNGDATSSELASILARSDAEVVALKGVGDDAAAGRVVVSPEAGKVIVISTSIPPVEPGRTYELWRVDADGSVHKAGLFEPDGSGKVEAAIDVSLDGAIGFAPELLPAAFGYALEVSGPDGDLRELGDRWEQGLVLTRIAEECFAEARAAAADHT